MQRGRSAQAAQMATLVACIVAGVFIALIALDTTPIADDYGDLASIGHSSLLGYLRGYWLGLTDRYSNAIFLVVLVKAFGVAAIHVATPLLVCALFCLLLLAARATARPGLGWRQPAAVAAAASLTTLGATPSLFDTLGWFNAVSIYLAGVVAAAGVLAWMAYLAADGKATRKRWHLVASFAIGLVAAGFTELIGIVIALGAPLAAINVAAEIPRGARRQALIRAYGAVAAGAAAGVAIIFSGPGSRARVRVQGGGLRMSELQAALHGNMVWISTFRWDAVGAFALGLLVFGLRQLEPKPAPVRWLAAWCGFLLVVPFLVMDLSIAYAGGVGVAAPRTAFPALASVAAGVAILGYLVAAATVNLHQKAAVVAGPVAALGVVASVVGFASAAISVIHAEQLRQVAVSGRATSIRRQLESHPKAVWVTPAPLAIVDTSAFDLRFHHRNQLAYVLEALRQYYGIPAETRVQIRERQPRDYCLHGVTVAWVGLKSCEQLRS